MKYEDDTNFESMSFSKLKAHRRGHTAALQSTIGRGGKEDGSFASKIKAMRYTNTQMLTKKMKICDSGHQIRLEGTRVVLMCM